jgi:3-dehydroquinate dehydratase II
MADILVIHGPNLNMLGQRESNIYGAVTLDEINQKLSQIAKPLQVECYQSNKEHELVEWVQESAHQFIIINAGAFTHSSIALRDAFLAKRAPFIEVHLSNIYARESFRHHSMLADIAQGLIVGLGAHSYYQAMLYVREHILKNKSF